MTGRTFKPERGKMLADFYRTMERGERPATAGRAADSDGLRPDLPA